MRRSIVSTTAPLPGLQALAETWQHHADVLRTRGDERAARLLVQCAAEMQAASPDCMTWLSEDDASRRSGDTVNQVRRHARLYRHTHYVRMIRGRYELLAVIVPRRNVHDSSDAAHVDIA